MVVELGPLQRQHTQHHEYLARGPRRPYTRRGGFAWPRLGDAAICIVADSWKALTGRDVVRRAGRANAPPQFSPRNPHEFQSLDCGVLAKRSPKADGLAELSRSRTSVSSLNLIRSKRRQALIDHGAANGKVMQALPCVILDAEHGMHLDIALPSLSS